MCASPSRSEKFASRVTARKSSNEQCGTGKPCSCFFVIRMSNVAEFNFAVQFLKRDNVRVIRAAIKKYADQKTERGKILNPEYSIFRDQPIPGASPLIVIRTD